MSNSGFTEFMAYMRLDGDSWCQPQIMSRREVSRAPQNSGVFFGLTVTQTVRVSPDDNSGAALFCVKQAITRLNIAAGERLIPMADEGLVLEALCRLVDNERHLLYDGGRFFARIMLSSDDVSLHPYPVSNAFLTITLWHDCEDAALRELCVCSDDSVTCGHMLRGEYARQRGFDGAMLLDSVYKKYILGLSGKNIFFRLDDAVVTPSGEGVFSGITRGCAVELMRDWGIDVKERRISVDELAAAYADGKLHEAFATDTFDIVSPVVKIDNQGTLLALPSGKLTKKLFDAIRNIERGTYPAPSGWIQRI